MKQFNYLILLMILLVGGCSQTKMAQPEVDKMNLSEHVLANNPQLQSFYLEWYGTPYQFGGSDKNGVDCSAFVQHAFSQAYQFTLPRTTREQFDASRKIEWQHKQQGDLLFFKTSKSDYHVGIYLGGLQFMHASTSMGVIISRLDNPYWADKFWQVRRVTL